MTILHSNSAGSKWSSGDRIHLELVCISVSILGQNYLELLTILTQNYMCELAVNLDMSDLMHYPCTMHNFKFENKEGLSIICHSYTPCTLCARYSQSNVMIPKIRESSVCALFLYNCTPSNFEHCLSRCLRVCRIDSLLHGYLNLLVNVYDILNLVKCLTYHICKR